MFHEMKYVYAVYQEMSFSRAAKRLYISQPSLSAAVRKEEQELGFPIFDRSTTPIRMTDFGMEYIRAAEKIMAIQRSFRQYAEDLQGLKTGTLTIGASNLFISSLLPPLLASYTARFPLVAVELVEGTADRLTQQLSDGRIDLMIDNNLLDAKVFDSRFCCYEQLMLVVPRELCVNSGLEAFALTARQIRSGQHLSTDTLSVPLERFRDEAFLLLRPGNDTRSRAEEICLRHGFSLRPRMEVEQQLTAYNLACSGMGPAFCGDLLIRTVPPSQNLVFYKLDQGSAVRRVCCYYKRTRYLTRAAREFLEMI